MHLHFIYYEILQSFFRVVMMVHNAISKFVLAKSEK
jgi:hypothetical protein